MPEKKTAGDEAEEEAKAWLGLTRERRYKIYAWGAIAIVVGTVLASG